MYNYNTYYRFKRLINKLVWRFYFSRSFKRFGKYSNIMGPEQIEGEEYITIEDNVFMYSRSTLIARKCTEKDPNLVIGKRAQIRPGFHAVCVFSIVIGDDVLVADNVYLSDNAHAYSDINYPIGAQPLKLLRPVRIGSNAWIGRNVCVIGASIGKHSVIGANSVVLKDVPDYSVAVGNPARIIKQFDFSRQLWVNV